MNATPWAERPRLARRYGLLGVTSIFVGAAALWGLSPTRELGPPLLDSLRASGSYAVQVAEYLAAGGPADRIPPAAAWPLLQVLVPVLALVAALICLGVAWTLWRRSDAYGDARYAKPSDLRRMKLGAKGVGPVLGRFKGKLILAPAPRHCLVIAPTRRGKTTSFVVPSILRSKGTLVVIDPKGELEALTRRVRERKGNCCTIDWANPDSPAQWSPTALAALPSGLVELERHVHRIAAMFFPKHAGDVNAHFTDSARRHCAALLLFECLEARGTGEDPHLGNIVARITSHLVAGSNDEDSDPFAELLLETAAIAREKGYPDLVSDTLSIWARMHCKERSSHLSTLVTGLQLMTTASVRGSTRKASFAWADLRRQPSTIYLRFPQQDAAAFGPLTALFLDCLFAWALDNPAGQADQPIHILGDEFASLPRIPLLGDFLAKGAGQGATISIVVQDLAQLTSVYGQDGASTIKTNCSYVVAFGQNNLKTQEELSNLVGKTTRMRLTHGNKLTWSPTMTDPSVQSRNAEGVALILPQEWGELPDGGHVLLVDGHLTRPVLMDSPAWFKDRRMRRELQP